MPTVSLAQALKAKSRLAKSMRENTNLLQAWNTIQEDTERAVSTTELYKTIKVQSQTLAKLKATIQQANTPIHEKLFYMSELNSLASTLKNLSKGESTSTYDLYAFAGNIPGADQAKLTSELSESYIIEERRRITKEIDNLQDEIDQFNASTKVDIPDLEE